MRYIKNFGHRRYYRNRRVSLFTTKVGQQTVKVSSFTILNKSLPLLPLPKIDAEGNIYDAFNDLN